MGRIPMKPRTALLVKLAVGFGLLALLFTLVDREALKQVLGQVNVWIILSLPVFYLHTAVKALRWQRYLHAQGVSLSFIDAFCMYTGGTFLGLVSPGRVGEIYRAWVLHREKGVNPGLGIASVLVDRLADIALLLAAGTAGLVYLLGQGFGAAAVAGGPVLPRTGAYLRRQFKRIMMRMPAPVAEELPGAYRVFITSLRNMSLPLVLQIFALTAISILIYCAHLYFIARVLGLPVGFWALTGILCASAFVNLIPITINAIGTRDAFLMATLPLLGVDRAQALGFSLLFLLLFVANTLMALPFWLQGRKTTPRDECTP